MPDLLPRRVERAVRERVFPGCVIGVIRDGSREVLPFGALRYKADQQVTENTIYDLASVTKSIPTASLALEFVAERTFSLTQPVKRFIPELRNDYNATIEDLLRYRVAGVQMSKLARLEPNELVAKIFETGFDGPPGRSRYTNLPAFLLGIVLERVAGERLDVLAHTRLFEPLGMRSTRFFPHSPTNPDPLNVRSSVDVVYAARDSAPTEIVDGVALRGIVHDESARVFSRESKAVGHAGLFSTAGDMLRFLETLLRPDDGFTKSITEGAQAGLGWDTEGDFLGTKHAGRFGKTGFTGTSIAADIGRGIGLVILSNRTFPKRPPDSSAINSFRKDIAELIFETEQ